MKTIYYGASSLNGFIADKNNSLDWLFQFDDGSASESGEAGTDSYKKFIKDVGAICMGSTTYQWLLDNHISKGGSWPYQMPTWVFTSRQLTTIPGADIRFAKGDVSPVHDVMVKVANGKNIWICGGGELAGKFYDSQLLSEIIWQLAPLTLDGGAPLFPRTVKPPFKLISVNTIGSTFVEVHYAVEYSK